MAKGINPLPSLLRASAVDAGNMQMRDGGRKKWNRADYNKSADTLNRLISACYGRKQDHNESKMCFVRFSIAEQMERAGMFNLRSKLSDIHATIDAVIAT